MCIYISIKRPTKYQAKSKHIKLAKQPEILEIDPNTQRHKICISKIDKCVRPVKIF